MADHLPRVMYGPPTGWRPMSSAALFCRDLHRRIRSRGHGHEGTALETGLERDLAVAKRVKGMVLAHAHAVARIELGAALAHDHIAAGDGFAAEQLHAQHLGVGIATVARGTASFLMCHTTGPLTGSDIQHLHLGEVLAVTAL